MRSHSIRPRATTSSIFRRWKSPPSVSFVARNDSEIVGCCALVEAGDGTAEIKRMFVDPRRAA